MALYSFTTPGFDPTSVPTPSNSQLLQMVQESRPAATTGMLVLADSAPDCVLYPDLARCHWEKTVAGIRTGLRYYYNGVAWVPDPVQPGVIGGDSFTDHSIPNTKLQPGNPYQLLQVNATGNEVVWIDPSTLFSNDLISLTALDYAPAAGYVPYSGVSGAYAPALYSTLWDTKLATASLPVIQLTDTTNVGSAGMVPVLGAAAGTFTPGWADQTIRDGKITQSKIKWETRTATSTAGAVVIDGQVAAAWVLTLTETVTSFQVSLTDGQTVTCAIIQGGAAYTVTFAAAIKWSGGLAPTITTTAGKADVCTFTKVGGIIYATVIQNF